MLTKKHLAIQGVLRKLGTVLTGLLLSVALTACQSGVAKLAGLEGTTLPSMKAVPETVGKGDAVITLLLPSDGQGLFGEKARAIRDGASLAIADLGGGKTKLNIVPITDTRLGFDKALPSILATKPVAILSYLPDSLTQTLTNLEGRPPLFDLVHHTPLSGKNVYCLAVNETGYVEEALDVAFSVGGKTVILFVQADYPESFASDVSAHIKKSGGTVLRVIRYASEGKKLSSAIRAVKATIKKADIAVIAGNKAATAVVLQSAKSTKPGLIVIGTSDWLDAIHSLPSAQGTLIVSYQRDNLPGITSRFQTRFSYSPTNEAAKAYDAAALISGLIRKGGKSAISGKNLRLKRGFTGATGLFRFDSSGTIERKAIPYTVANKKLNPLQPLQKAF